MKDFFAAVKDRRTYYGISKASPVSDDRIKEIVRFAVKHVPSAFNSQSGRAVLLLGKSSDEFWSMVKESLRKIVPADKFAPTEEKINGFGSGYGTVLFFEDSRPVKNLQEQFPSYAAHFPVWSDHSSGMLQYIVWAGLESEGFGASLQHYAPVVEDDVRKKWDIPAEWSLIAQMPFGVPVAGPGEKEFLPLEDRVWIRE
ncbi:MAG: nitroreductase family protein [Aminivibrio sp.]|jgi:predicted oxidoreductase (fatty acid repression mutant protein)|uniref:nitroreductase family protein n=1 Tax=Aminivibrio sp. TaxID=1872489 RepID=UPI002B20EF53|nr:nitroreductase family protein [Aminivibrio sp.]MEA4953081.1 nitroreductase family protein [Aminivibrio sp.]